MTTDVVSSFVNLCSCEYYYDAIRYGLKSISTMHSDNSSLWQDFVSFHSQANTLVFVLICGIFFALLVWILSLVTGVCTWVNIRVI